MSDERKTRDQLLGELADLRREVDRIRATAALAPGDASVSPSADARRLWQEAEAALRESEARYRAVVETQTELIVRFLPGGILTFVNEAYCRYFNRRREELIGVNFLPWLPEGDREQAARRFASITPADPVVDHEHRVLMPSGEVRWMHWSNRGIFDPDGRLTEFQGTGRDITHEKAAEEALRQSEANYHAIFDAVDDAIFVHDLSTGEVLDFNRRASEMYGYGPHELDLLNAQFRSHRQPPYSYEEQVRGIRKAARGDPQAFEWLATDRGGRRFWVEVSLKCAPIGGRDCVLAVLRDISERMRLEEELREALKMEAVGQLAGGIAHDFNNLMTGILCHAGLLKTTAESPRDVRETADVIEGAARRAAQLTSQLLGFARRGKHQDVPVDLGAAIETTVALLSRTLDPRVRVATRLGPDRVFAQGDPPQIEQVILNLAMNARDAMPEGGEMTFATAAADIAEADCAGHARARPGRYAVVTVADTGCGIPTDLRARIFEPFFTTKPRGRGAGMGLAMVYGIVRNHGGWVEVASEVGRGTTFRVFLPLAEERAGAVAEAATEAPGPDAAAPPAPARAGRILIVDDEELVRNVVSRTLAGLGYETLTAADGREAVDLYRRLGGDVNLVIIDMIMPEMDGRECFLALRRLNPAVRAILCTGGGASGTVQDVLDEGMVGFVQKPYQAAELARAVREALGR